MPPSTPSVPDDPLFGDQWYLDNTGQNGGTPGKDIDVLGAWSYATGTGVTIVVNDTGVDYTNPDIAPNYDAATSGSLDAPTNSGYPYNTDELTGSDADDLAHGTAVAGLIAAAKNDYGIIGVAYDATISSFRVIDTAAADNNIFSSLADAFNNEVTDNFDIANNSWEFTAALEDSVFAPGVSTATSALLNAATVGRNGLGTINVFAAGNYYTQGDDTNLHAFQSSINVITVAALDDNGTVNAPSSEGGRYSTPGTTILVSAPGTDIVSDNLIGSGGSLAGFAADGYASTNDGAQVFGLDGTSFAAPLVSGVIALMLQVNPNLGLRDVQEILAYTAVQTDPTDSTWLINDADNWNGGGLHVSRDYGFGLVDATAAVALAQSWPLQETIANRTVDSINVNSAGAIAGGGTTFTFTVTSADELTLQWVRVQLDLSFASYGNLKVVLTSPGGARSLLLDGPNDGIGGDEVDTELQLTSDQFWGQTSVGTWRLTISDVGGTSSTGTLFSTTNDLVLVGDPVSDNGLYVYTDEYASELATDASRGTLTASNGDNTLDLAAVTTNCVIDPAPGAVCTIDGAPLTIGADATITTEIGGNGDDTFIGAPGSHTIDGGEGTNTIDYSDAPAAVTVNLSAGTASNGFGGTDSFTDIQDFVGGRGNDVFIGGPGSWTIDGGGGTNILDYSGASQAISVNLSTGIAQNGFDGTDTIANIETVIGSTRGATFVGGAVGETFVLLGGTNTVQGESGPCTVIFPGIRASYGISFSGANFTVIGPSVGATLISVGWLQFADGTLAVSADLVIPFAGITSIVGTGDNLLGAGGHDLFLHLSTGQLAVWEVNASGALLAPTLRITSGGSPADIDDATIVVGTGWDLLGAGGEDIFLRSSTGQLVVWEVDGTGALLAPGLRTTSDGGVAAIDDATAIVGTGTDLLGDGGHDLFLRLSTGQLAVWEVNASGALLAPTLRITASGAPAAIDEATTVVGTGTDLLGDGGQDIFLRSSTGQLVIFEVDGSGSLLGSDGRTTLGGDVAAIDGATTVAGTGFNLLGLGGHDIFLRSSSGELVIWEVDGSGALLNAGERTTFGGGIAAIDGATTVAGTGSDLLGLGGDDIFLRSQTGQLVIWEVDGSGDLLNGGVRTTLSGAVAAIDGATTVVGTGSDLLGLGGNDIFLRSITGQLVIWEVNSSGALLNAGARTTVGDGIAAIDSETTIAGTATDLLGDGGNDILLRLGSGQLAVWEVNGSGALLANTDRMPVLGSGASAHVLVGTTGGDTLSGPSGASTLIGNGGNDTYVFGAGTQEVIVNGTTGNVAAQGALVVTATNSDTNVWLDRVDDSGNVSSTGNNLRIEELGTTSSATIDNWFAAGDVNAQLVEIVLPGASGGALVLNSGVSALVNAMATFEANYQMAHGAAFDPTNPANAPITDPTVLTAVNANWHH